MRQQAQTTLSAHGLFVILSATAIALLATPLAAPAMPEIARIFADNARSEVFARTLIRAISFLPGEPSVPFLVKFILLSIPAAFIVIGAPIVGWICDHWSKKKLLIGSLLLFGVSGVSGYFATSFLFLFIGRALLGLAIAGIKTATVAMVGDYYTGALRNRVIGWQGSAMKLGGVIFMLLGGVLANFNWQIPFTGYLLAFLIVPSALIALVDRIPDLPARDNDGAAVPAPPVPFWACTGIFISATLASALFFVTPVQLPFYLRSAFGASPFQMGLAVAVGNTVGALISLYYHRLRNRLSFQAIYALIFLTMGIGYYLVALSASYTVSLVGMVVAGIGFGLYVPNHSAWILSIVSPLRRGFGVGIVTTAMFVGQFLSPLIVQGMARPDSPSVVWRAMAATLGVLALVYGALAAIKPMVSAGQKKASNL